LTTYYDHDAIGWQVKVTDPRGNETTTVYWASTEANGKKNQVDYVQAPGEPLQSGTAYLKTVYGYDLTTGRVNLLTRKRVAGTETTLQTERYAYDPKGRQTHVWGSGPYPVKYQFDDYGRKWKMWTYKPDASWSSSET
jgi:hypothetical protein